MKSSVPGQDGETETRYTVLPERTKKIKTVPKYMKWWFSKHRASGDEGQWSLRHKKQLTQVLWLHLLPWENSQTISKEEQTRQHLVDSLSGGDRAESLKRSQWLEFTGQSSIQKKNAERELQRFAERPAHTDQHITCKENIQGQI